MSAFFRRVVRPVLHVLFGDLHWSPPAWLRVLLRPLVGAARRLGDAHRRSPRCFWSAVAVLILLVVGGYGGWRWWQSRPKPHLVTWQLSTPDATALEPEATPRPLVIRFSDSAAPLEFIGKPVSAGVTVAPPLEGTWSWASDTELVFAPAGDWEVGRDYTVRFEPSFFGPQVRLESYRVPFSSPAFAVRIDEYVFHEDPTDPKDKSVVATVRFSHPVDRADFEKRIGFKLRVEPVESFDDPSVKPFGFKVSYDEVGGKAYIHSEPVALPERDGLMRLAIAPGVRAARGGPGTADRMERFANVPGLENYFRLNSARADVVTNTRDEVERLLVLDFSAGVRTRDLQPAVTVYLLPKDRPATGDQPVDKNHYWSDVKEIVPEVLAAATPLAIDWLPTEREFSDVQHARFQAEAGAHVFVTVRAGVAAFGGYPLVRDATAIVHTQEFPRAVRILHDGSLLSLTGERTVSVLARNVPAVRLELSRLVPGSVAHLLSQSDSDSKFQSPRFANWHFGLDNISEVFHEVRALPPLPPGQHQYVAFDLTRFLRDGTPPRGLFSLAVTGWDPKENRAIDSEDRRLVLVTDLGVLAKRTQDGGYDVFLQSIRSGAPVAGARVDVLGKNGVPVLLGQTTDADGRVRFPRLTDFTRERRPVAFVAQLGGDYTFLPYDRGDRRIDLSRFEVGGEFTDTRLEGLQAYLFSDRGIYRPGEEIHLGMIVKRLDWQPLPDGLPLQLEVIDPRGLAIRKQTVTFPADGFEQFALTPAPSAPTGPYEFKLSVVREKQKTALLASARVRVEEFQPDRLVLKAALSAAPRPGWISPAELRCDTHLRNLFGTPVSGGKVKGSLRLSAALPDFSAFPDHHFHDPVATKKSYDETLAEVVTDASGHATFDLQLDRFENATYRVQVAVEGFGAEGGRSVSANAGAIVSPLAYLIGWKADGELGYIHTGSAHGVELIAIDPDLKPTAVDGLEIELFEVTHPSVLTKQENGTFAYQSVRRETSRRKEGLAIPVAGSRLPLPTDQPGSFFIAVRDRQGTELNRISFDVVGEGNVSRSLERSGELRVKLNKADYAPGEDIEVAIQAPYAGAGLITIERDRIYASQWFVSSGNSTLQHIRLPADLEGNGYVVVSFVRSLGAAEIYTSPLSNGAAPFSVSRERHTQPLALDVPAMVRPGAELRIGYHTGTPARLAVFAVDEGILQVARYRAPDPLGSFYRKRALEVATTQILDLILPEFSRLQALSAPGGDDDAFLAGVRNPFKRKGLPPVAYWSGILTSDGTPGAVTYRVPEHFNGTIRVFAVAVSPAAIGVGEATALARGPFVIEPTLAYFVAPGDEFELPTLVANTLDQAAAGAAPSRVTVSLETSPQLEVVGAASAEMDIPLGHDATAMFRLRARPQPGVAVVTLRARSGAEEAKLTLDMSVRPASAYVTTVSGGIAGRARAGAELPVTRTLYDDERNVEASAFSAPLGLARGLRRYLDRFPYECTEQVVSQAFAAVVLAGRPELAGDPGQAVARVARAVATLQARQDADGAFGLWSAASPSVPFVTAYATHFLLAARERGLAIPPALFERALEHANTAARRDGATNLVALRAQAYALYLLARNGAVVTAPLNALREQLDKTQAEAWRGDLTALFIASTYRLLKLDREASAVLDDATPFDGSVPADYQDYYDDLLYRGFYLYLVSRHFPERVATLPVSGLTAMVDAVVAERFNSLSASVSILALDAHARALGAPAPGAIAIEAISATGVARPLALTDTFFPAAIVPPDAVTVRFSGAGDHTLYYQLVQAGYDAAAPATVLRDRVEVFRELRGPDGTPIGHGGVTDKVEVHVIVRSLDETAHDVAVVDLLPGGFEVDLSPGGLADRVSIGQGADTWQPEHIEVREDRVVFHGTATPLAQRFVYRIKPLSRGSFAVPPLYAEGLYDRAVVARSLAGRFTVE